MPSVFVSAFQKFSSWTRVRKFSRPMTSSSLPGRRGFQAVRDMYTVYARGKTPKTANSTKNGETNR